MERTYLIYKHTNKINGKVYIGQTCQRARIRWQYGDGYRHNLHFYAAIKKYGWNNFEHEILYTSLTKEEADELEIQLIAKYKATNSQFGYNSLTGGANGAKYLTEEERIAARKVSQHEAYKKMVANMAYAEQMRKKSLELYYANKKNADYMNARSYSNHKSRQKVKQIRDKLRNYFVLDAALFTLEEIDLAFGFVANNKSYKCNSIKKLEALLELVESRIKNEEKKSKN